jgi:hypothetical protein
MLRHKMSRRALFQQRHGAMPLLFTSASRATDRGATHAQHARKNVASGGAAYARRVHKTTAAGAMQTAARVR